MKIDQVAFYARDEAEVEKIKNMFGLANADWIQDTVTAQSSIHGSSVETNVAQLEFNYSLGIELEILRYVSGPCWHDAVHKYNDRIYLSHIGIHLDDDEDFPAMPHAHLVQETWTQSHTSDYIAAIGRRYHYKIFELSLGNYIKYIKRIHKGATDVSAK